MSDIHELAIERVFDAPVAAVWRAWTEHGNEWWAPKPWTATIIEQDLRAGGASIIDMRGPDGEGGPMSGIFLDVKPNERIVFTNAIDRDGNPQSPQPVSIIGFFEFTAQGDRTHYRAGARHWTAEAMEQHRAMGFEQGWGICADQLGEVAKKVAETTDA